MLRKLLLAACVLFTVSVLVKACAPIKPVQLPPPSPITGYVEAVHTDLPEIARGARGGELLEPQRPHCLRSCSTP